MPWRCKTQDFRFVRVSIFSAPLLPACCCFFSPTLELEVASRSKEVIIPHLLTWLASSPAHPGRKPVNWTKAAKEVRAVIALGGEAVGLGLVQSGEGGMALGGQPWPLALVGGG